MPREPEPISALIERIAEKLGRARAAAARERPDPQQTLRRRARELAREIRPEQEGETLEVIEFRVGAQRLACEAAWIKEVFRLPRLVGVPGAPPFIAGVVNLRGRIVSVVDLRRFLGLENQAEEPGAVLLLAGAGMEFGLLAGRVEEARPILRRELAPPPSALPPERLRFLLGVLPDAVSLLDGRRLLGAPEMRIEQRESPISPERTTS